MWDASRPSFPHWVRLAGQEPLGRMEGAGRERRLPSSRPGTHRQALLREFERQLELFFLEFGDTYFCLEMNRGRRPGGAAGEARVRRCRATGAAHGG